MTDMFIIEVNRTSSSFDRVIIAGVGGFGQASEFLGEHKEVGLNIPHTSVAYTSGGGRLRKKTAHI